MLVANKVRSSDLQRFRFLQPFCLVAFQLVLILLSIRSMPLFGQTSIQGKASTQGSAQAGSPYSHYVQIMALFPPAYNPGSNSDYTNFQNNVMTQKDANGLPIVDGVTLEIVWSNVETQPPGPTSCGPATDTCQLDAVGQYHTYSWATYDSNASMTYPNSVIPWFSSFGVGPRKVNFILSGINTSNGINTATPWYVTSSTYIANFPSSPTAYNRQDVVNTATCPSTTVPWQGNTATSYSRTSPSSTVTVTASNCCGTGNPLQAGDPIWVFGDGDMNSVSGATILTTPSSSTFTYKSQGTSTTTTCLGCAYISAFQSSPVPYEMPYTVAWEALIAAANLHFNPSYTPHSTNLGPQLGYMRSGTWVGGESFVYCPTDLMSLSAPYAYSVSVWLSDYQKKVNYVQSLSPTMVRYWPIDPNTTPDTMALYAISANNGHGFINGFGSQGLSARDSYLGCASANADWCNLFSSNTYSYYALGMPRELQQISISDETQDCTTAGACGTPPKTAGDLRQWLPFAVSHEATVFEMYYLDLALAFDNKYCPTQSGGACSSGYGLPSYITTTQQATWCNDVGLCNSSCPGASTCYAYSIEQNHGPH